MKQGDSFDAESFKWYHWQPKLGKKFPSCHGIRAGLGRSAAFLKCFWCVWFLVWKSAGGVFGVVCYSWVFIYFIWYMSLSIFFGSTALLDTWWYLHILGDLSKTRTFCLYVHWQFFGDRVWRACFFRGRVGRLWFLHGRLEKASQSRKMSTDWICPLSNTLMKVYRDSLLKM